MKHYVAIDIGGTNIKYGLINEAETLVEAHEMPTEAHKGGPGIMQKVEGIVAAYLEPIPWYMSFVEGTKDLWDSTVEIYQSLGLLLSGQALDQLSGPVGILNVTARTAELGLNAYLSLVGLISVNVGIFNLIPIPALDGGRVLIL